MNPRTRSKSTANNPIHGCRKQSEKRERSNDGEGDTLGEQLITRRLRMETKVMKVDEAGEGVEWTGSRKKEERKHGS